ncbi:MAG: carbamoyltransferase [Flavobacteriales bacterium]|nr:carbamoyltransferase [Flavobacteriales bacterium]
MKVLGISALYHDSAASIVVNGEIIAAAQEERFTRVKQDASFPVNAIQFCLAEAGIQLSELDAVVFYDKPLLKFERLLETYFFYAPKGILSFVKSMPVWINEKMFFKKLLKQSFKKIGELDWNKTKLLFPEHHLSHAASAFFPSRFDESAILTIDGVGEWATVSISKGSGNEIKVLKEINFPNSLGLLYSSFTYFLGFKVNSGEYKLMGMAPYGNLNSKEVDNFISIIKRELITLFPDGSFRLNQRYFNYATGLRMVKDKKWQKLFGIEKRRAESIISQQHCNLAIAIQKVTEEVVLLLAKEAKRLTGLDSICLAGGVALNCVSNGVLQRSGIFSEMYIQPASGDAGGALGAALAGYYIYFKKDRSVATVKYDLMKGSFLGPSFSNKEVRDELIKRKAVFAEYEDVESLLRETAKLIDKGNVIGWFQGKMEFGPRALGNRSIIGDPRNMEMQRKINLKIKYREGFRPFAPSVLEEDVSNFFDYKGSSPYMLEVHSLKSEHKVASNLISGFTTLKERLDSKECTFPATTHVDDSARIQTVSKDTNQRYWRLINAFKSLTGCPMVVNTSFNVRGEPMVSKPFDAYRCFMETEMDVLVIGDFLMHKDGQPEWKSLNSKKFKLD